MLILIFLLFVAGVFFWQFNRMSTGSTSKPRAISLFAGYSTSPVLLYLAVFLVFIGIEEISTHAIIGEGYARSLPFVIAGGLAVVVVATIIFSLLAFTIRK